MEVRARYVMMGLFALAVIAFGFAFVYWLHATGGLGERVTYRIKFHAPIVGLLKGSDVMFNGVRVGEVSSIELKPDQPDELLVSVAIQRSAPVRADTAVGIAFQGIGGAPAISLSGGTPSQPLLASKAPPFPVLDAGADVGQSLTQTAQTALKRLDTVISENAKPFTAMIANIEKFSAALSRNSDKVDGILAGLERLTGGGKKKQAPFVFDLSPAKSFPGIGKIPTVQLHVAEPTTLIFFDTEKIRLQGKDAPEQALADAQWPDLLSKVVQTRVLQSFENAGYLDALGRLPDSAKPAVQLVTEIRRFSVVADGGPATAQVDIAVRLIKNEDGSILGARVFKESIPAADLSAPVVTKALGEAFSKVLQEIVVWTCTKI